MVKFIFCLRRLPTLNRAQFQDYWLNNHGPLVLSYRERLGMSRYVQVHTATTSLDSMLVENSGGHQPFDGVSESWWESVEAFKSALLEPDSQKIFLILREDEQKFIDQPNSLMWFAEEHQIL
jgi:uncharacterized protein (TIGR02118 family)